MWWRIVAMMATASFLGSFLGTLTELYMAYKNVQEVNKRLKAAQSARRPPQAAPGGGNTPTIPEETTSKAAK